MSTIGNVLNSARTNFEVNSQASGGDLFATVSAVNNLWSEFNNSGSSSKEVIRSFILLVQDAYGLFVKSTNHNIANSLTKIANLSDRLWSNVEDFNKITDPLNITKYDNGYVKKSLVLDIFADAAAIFSEAMQFTKLSPLGTVANILSMYTTAISNAMNTNSDWNDKQKIHESEIDDLILDSAALVLSNWAGLVAPLGDVLLNILPDGLNPWKDNPVDLTGSDANDVIAENINKAYTIFANGGNDNITGGRFNDYIDGGSGNDQLYGGEGNDTLIGGIDSDELLGGIGLDNLYGGQGEDYLYGGAGEDILYGGLGEDRLYGGNGDDKLYLAHNSHPDQVALDTDNNFAEGGAGNDLIHGSDGDDIIFTAEDGNGGIDASTENYAWGYKGRDILKGGDGVDYLYGGDGTDSLHGGKGNDKLYGGKDNDHLYGEDGDDELYAGRIKHDTLDSGNNFLYGGKGDDILYGGAGYDVLVGGEGFDIYKAYGETLIDDREGDGKGKIFYHDRELMGARITYKSESLAPPPISSLDFSKKGYELKDLGFVGFAEIAGTRTAKSVSYIVTGKVDFTYKELTTEGVGTRNFSDTDLGVRFIVTVHKDKEPPPPPNIPPNNPPTRSDPLILDLDHDGKINTKSLNQGVNFDLDGNEFAEKTSWVAPQDGFVVLDLNDNGKIDNGGELFGTDTLLANGNKAVDGFQALAQYDENQDKVIDAQDQIYQQLKIWKDINQDGISQTDELFTLSDLGITSISVNHQIVDTTDENDVIHTNKATFTQEVLENGVLITKTGLAETLLFQVNTSNTVWQGEDDENGIPADILELPNFVGYGSVASLHTVMANDTTGVLKNLVSQFATTPAEDQLALTHQILLYWTNKQHISASESTYYTEGMNKQQFEILKAIWGKEAEWNGWPPHHSAARELEGFYQKLLANTYSQLLIQTTKKDLIDLVIFQEEQVYETTIKLITGGPSSNGQSNGGSASAVIRQHTFDGTVPEPHPDSSVLNAPWKHVDTIWHANFSLAIESLTGLFLQKNELGKIEIEKFHLIIRDLDPNHEVLYKELLEQFTLKAQDITDENLRDLLLESVYALDDNLSGTEQNDVIKSFGGNDSIAALGGDDVVYGGKGDDIIYGGTGNDYLDGGADNDKIYGESGDDTLVGGAGNDYLDGGAGNDTYVFSLGDGQDTIQSYENNASKLDRIVFDDGIEVADVSLKRQDNDLIVKYSENDQVTVKNYFDSNGATAYRIDQIVFADGTVWNVEVVKAKVLEATAANDVIQGYSSADQLSGLAGNDTIYGHAGNDTLIGGTGNDYLDGGAGNDSYVFSLGDGQDTIQSYENNASKLDRIVFDDGIEVADVSLKRQDNDLIVKYSENDQVAVKNYFDSNGATAYRIDQIVFADGTVWNVEVVKAKVLEATAANDVIQGYSSADQLSGLAGNDTIYGHAGNDTLTGGTGNDYLDGGAGNDSYVFSLGDGQDTIQSYENNASKLDRIVFNAGIEVADVSLKRQDNDLIVKYSENDQVAVKNYFDSNGATAYRIDQIVFADGTVWNVEVVKAKVVEATAANDVIQGYSSADQLNGLAGNDSLYGYAGNDTLTGGTGNDYLDGGAGNDSYVFSLGDGQDTIQSYESNASKLDRIIFTDGITATDVTVTRQGNDLIVKYSENDQVTVKYYFDSNGATAYRIDQIVFADETVWDVETIKIKVLTATAGDDVINGYNSADQLNGLAGNDSLYGHAGNDTLTGGTGNDRLDGGTGNDTYVFATNFGHDIIYNYDSAQNRQDVIQFTDGLTQGDFTFRRNNDDLVIRTVDGENSITVQNYFQSDALGHYRIDQIQFSDSTTLDVQAVKALVLLGTMEADVLRAYTAGSTISGEAGDDVIYGHVGSDQLSGGSGLDTIYGGQGNDQLNGGEGDDRLDGGDGNDTYIFAANFGHDIIYNYDSAQNRQDVIQFTDGLIQSDFTFQRNNDDLVIRTVDGESSITVQNYFYLDALGHYRIDQIQFSDNTTLDVEAVKALVLLGTAEADILRAYTTGSSISGEAGDDVIYGNTGSDQLYGGDGVDKLYGGTGNDHLDGGSGDDQLYGDIGHDTLIGGSGDDQLNGGEGDDLLDGGTGQDILTGGAGNDTYVFAPNFGHDIISNYDSTVGRQDIIQFTDGLIQGDLTFRRNNDDLVIRTREGENSITVQHYFNFDAFGNYRIDQIKFSDNTILNVEAVKALVLLGTDNADLLQAYATGSTIFGGAGDDDIYGNIGVDQLYGGDGKDKLYGGNGHDQLYGGADNDQIYGGLGNDTLTGGTGNDLLDGDEGNDNLQGGAGNDILIAGSGDDILTGGMDNDELTGGDGNDTYIFAANFGHDIINNYDSGQNRQDIIQFTEGLIQSDFTFRRNNDDLVIRTLNGENSITVQNYFQSDALGHYRIDQIQFSDSTTLNVETVKTLVLLGTAEADILRAYTTGSTISGEAGDDVIHGNIGSDQLYGGDGLDKLYGSDGDDHLDGGADDDQLYAGNGNDVLIGGSGNDLLDAGEGADQLYGGTGNDVLNGGAGNDLLDGGDGSDQLNGGTGDDILVGGSGNDVLIGGQGNDTYRFDLGWGQDTIQYESKNQTDVDVIEFININPNDLIVRKVGQDMVIVHRTTGDQLVVESQFSDYLSNKPINKVRFDDQTEWDEAALNIQAVKGTELDDIIEGTTDQDVIHAGAGDDIVYGRSVYLENPETQYFVYGGEGNDKIYATGYLDGGAGDDEIEGSGHLLGGEGNDILNGQGVLEGQAGNDTLTGQGKLYGGDGQDHLTLTGLYGEELGLLAGGSGDDILIVDVNRRQFVNGSNQNEFIQDDDGYHAIQDTELTEAQRAIYVEGGQGNDTIYGSFGDEVYLFNLGDGQDTIIERPAGQNYSNVAVSFDVLRFGQGIATTDISLHRYGNDLVIQHSNQTDQITIQNYFVGGHHKINEIQFADSTTWNNFYIENHVIYHGTANNDEVWGYRNTHETFEMGAGDDKVYSGAGNDIIYGQAGDDILWGQAGNDTLYGGIGADYLEGNEGDDILYGDQDNDILYGGAGNDILYGGQGDDTLRGGTGHDILDGGAGNDKYFYYLADGTEIIDQTGGGTDVLWLMDQGITEDRIKFTKENNDLIVTIDNNPNQSVRVKDHFLGGEKAISSVQPNGGYTITAAQIAVKVNASSGGSSDPAGDTIYQYSSGAMTITEQSGNDTVLFKNGITFSQVGNYLTKSGDDLILKVNGSNTNKVTIKNFFKAGQYLVETLQFETGGQLTAEQIFGAFGLTIPSGTTPTPPNPVGDTTYNYSSGELTITEQSGNDKVIFKNGITFSQVGNYLTKSGDDLILKVNGSNTNKVTVKNFFLAGNYLVENFEFETGGNLTAEQVFGAFGLTLPPTGGGNQGSSEVAGDTVYNYTTGALTITEHSGNDKVIFKNGITFNQVGSYLTKSGDDLILKVNGSNTNKVTVKNFFLAGQYLVETFQFETGGQITAEQIFGAFGITMPQQSAPANIPPENTNLDAFNTTYNYSSGAMVIDEKLGTDQVVFGNGITFSQVGNYLTKSGDDLILKVNGSNSNKVTVKDFFLGGAHEVESFNFETGGSISSQQIYQVFGVDRPVNAEDEVTSIVMGDSGDNVLSSDAAVSELFILNEGNDILELLLNASGETAVDYVTDFDMAEDQIDLSQILDSHATSSNLSSYIEIIYDTDAKTNTLSVRGQSNQAYKDVLVMTNQSEQLYLQDLINNQSLIY